MVKLLCTDYSRIFGNIPQSGPKILSKALFLAISLGWLACPSLAAQAPDAPSEPKTEESAPKAPRDNEEKGQPNPSPTEKPPKPAEKEPKAVKESEGPVPPKTAQKSAVNQPEVAWDEAVAAVLAKKAPENAKDLGILQKQVQSVVRHAMPATLGVQLGNAAGSAIIVSPDGLVLTAGHVAGKPGQPVNCFFPDGRRVRGITLGMNREIDSGMIRLNDKGPWPYVKLAEQTVLKPGEWVVGMGHAGGFDPRRTPPVRLGRVLYQNDEVIHTDCALVGGDSGGPLFNLRGELVGIHSRIGRRLTSNFHVPVSTYRDTWDRLVASEVWGGRLDSSEPIRVRPTLGLAVQNGKGRCRVTQVFPTGPARPAGIEVGDVIQQFAGEKVASTDELTKLLWKKKPGDRITLEIERNGESMKIEMRLGQIAQTFPGSPVPPKDAEQES